MLKCTKTFDEKSYENAEKMIHTNYLFIGENTRTQQHNRRLKKLLKATETKAKKAYHGRFGPPGRTGI
jgi:hypothetical protein